MNNTRVLLADDHAVVREGLKALIANHPEFEVVGEAADGPAAVALAAQLDPDVVVVDNGSRDGSAAIARRHRAVVVQAAAPSTETATRSARNEERRSVSDIGREPERMRESGAKQRPRLRCNMPCAAAGFN